MKKILLSISIISCMSISNSLAMSHEQRESDYKCAIQTLRRALMYFELDETQGCLALLTQTDASGTLWKKNRETVLESAEVAVTSANTSHKALIEKYAPITPKPEFLFYEKSFERTVNANLNNKRVITYDKLHNTTNP